MHIDRITDRAELMARRIFGPPKSAPAQSQVLADIEAGRARQIATERDALTDTVPHVYVGANGRLAGLVGTPIAQPAPGTFPPGWTDVHSDEYRQEDE